MDALNEEIATLDEKLADSATYQEDSSTLNTLLTEQGQARTRLVDVEQSWLSRQEALEEALALAEADAAAS